MPYITAAGLILAIGLAWIAVQHAYRRFAARHPEFGPAKEIIGCGLACTCAEPCEKRRRSNESN